MKPAQDDSKYETSRRAHFYQEWAFWANFFWTLPSILYLASDACDVYENQVNYQATIFPMH